MENKTTQNKTLVSSEIRKIVIFPKIQQNPELSLFKTFPVANTYSITIYLRRIYPGLSVNPIKQDWL